MLSQFSSPNRLFGPAYSSDNAGDGPQSSVGEDSEGDIYVDSDQEQLFGFQIPNSSSSGSSSDLYVDSDQEFFVGNSSNSSSNNSSSSSADDHYVDSDQEFFGGAGVTALNSFDTTAYAHLSDSDYVKMQPYFTWGCIYQTQAADCRPCNGATSALTVLRTMAK